MKTVICLSGLDTAEFLERALPKIPRGCELSLLYVIDTRPAEELDYLRHNHIVVGRSRNQTSIQIEEAGHELAQIVINEGLAYLSQAGIRVENVESQVLHGRPERLITSYAEGTNPDLLVVGIRYKTSGDVPESGPASIGPVARYIIDHVGCDLLLIK